MEENPLAFKADTNSPVLRFNQERPFFERLRGSAPTFIIFSAMKTNSFTRQIPFYSVMMSVLLLAGFCFDLARAQDQDWKVLFDGKNLDQLQLTQEDGWKIVKNTLEPNPIRKDNYVWTKETFEDFVLTVDFKMSKGCNSGVFFRTDPANPVQGGFEIQVFDSHGKPTVEKHDCGALYDAVAPSKNTAKPAGEWNKLRIRCKGPQVIVFLNGEQVVKANLDDWKTANKNPDGTDNKFKTALKDLPRTGHIGLQYHGHPVWFRNMKIKGL